VVLTIRVRVGERTTAIALAAGGVAASATCGGIAMPAPRSARASFEAASLAGSAEKPLALVEPLKPELKASPESGPM
jgi:hypothetical protein